MNKKIVLTLTVLLIGLTVFGLINKAAPVYAASDLATAGNGTGSGYVLQTTGTLTNAEKNALLYMYEEEKLAHDVYAFLYSKWSLPVFQNIAQSELTHLEAIKTLVVRYGLTVPVNSQAGVFSNTELQKLYTDLTTQGSLSSQEALKAGVAIETRDIQNLQAYLAIAVQADVKQVFNNLLSGSNHHLQAFSAVLGGNAGQLYQPQNKFGASSSTTPGYARGTRPSIRGNCPNN